MSGQVD